MTYELSDEMKGKEIAKAVGWHIPDGCTNYRVRPDGGKVFFNIVNGSDPVPDYLESLEAMHEAESTLTPENVHIYENYLALQVYEDDKDEYWTGGKKHINACCLHATARQRAEAFGRTLGLW